MSNVVFKESDIQTYELSELQGKHVEVVSVGITKEGSLMYLRDLENNHIYVVGLDQRAKQFQESRQYKGTKELENQEKIFNVLRSEAVRKLKRKYGKYKGFSVVDLAFSFMTMTNDDFFKLYGFNYVPKVELQDIVKSLLYENTMFNMTSIKMNGNISVQAHEQIKQQLRQALNSDKSQIMNVFRQA